MKERVGIGKSRASELMLIADGTKTVAQVRAETQARTEKARQISGSPLRSGEIGAPKISVSEPGPDGEIRVTIVIERHVSEAHEPGCPNAVPCPECGCETVLVPTIYRCANAEAALGIVRAYTDPESYGLLRRIVCLHHSSVTRSRELAQWLAEHPQYPAETVAGWVGCDEAHIEDLRRWAKSGFDKREMPL